MKTESQIRERIKDHRRKLKDHESEIKAAKNQPPENWDHADMEIVERFIEYYKIRISELLWVLEKKESK